MGSGGAGTGAAGTPRDMDRVVGGSSKRLSKYCRAIRFARLQCDAAMMIAPADIKLYLKFVVTLAIVIVISS